MAVDGVRTAASGYHHSIQIASSIIEINVIYSRDVMALRAVLIVVRPIHVVLYY